MPPAPDPWPSPGAAGFGAPPLAALVVLGCRVGTRAVVGASRRRVETAHRAFVAGLAPQIVVTGGRTHEGALEATVMARALRELGVPADALVEERAARDTWENARFTAPLLRGAVRPVGVVTCDWHLPRALELFRAHGLRVLGVPAVSPGEPPLRQLWRAARERVALTFDRIRAP